MSKIIGRYTDDVKNASTVINSYLRKGEFIIFDLDRPEDDPLATRLRFDTPLDLQKEIENRNNKSADFIEIKYRLQRPQILLNFYINVIMKHY